MELRHLRYFTALAETLHFTRAAERVHVTQSTLSHQIKQLEEEIGYPLFDRKGKKVILTQEGEFFLGYATRALREIDQGLSVLKHSNDEISGLVRIGTTHTFNLNFLPQCISTFISDYPTVHISVVEDSANAIETRLRAGTLDIGITYQATDPAGLHFEPLYDEQMVLIVRKTHPFSKRKRIRMAELHRQKIALLPDEFSTRRMLNRCFIEAGAEPQVVAEMNTIAPIIAMVGKSDVVSIVGGRTFTPNSEIVAIPLESPTPVRTPGLLWRRDADQSMQVRAFAVNVRKRALALPASPSDPEEIPESAN